MNTLLWRIVEDQANWVLRNNVQGDDDDIQLLEELVNETKSLTDQEIEFQRKGYHILIYSPFRYDLPVLPKYQVRFKPPYHNKNVFYGSLETQTSYYEYAYHWMRQRFHIKNLSTAAERRTIFSVNFKGKNVIDIQDHPNIDAIMDKNDYSASHSFASQNKKGTPILYPSARKQDGLNMAIMNITDLEKKPDEKHSIHLIFSSREEKCRIITHEEKDLYIFWKEVS